MSKSGQLVLKAIVSLLISALVIVLYPIVGQTYANRETFKNMIVARDIALTIDALYSRPYDATVYYEKDLAGSTVEFSGSYVKVYDRSLGEKFDPSLAEYKFFTTGHEINAKFESPKKIKFEKKGNILTIKKDETIK